MPAQYLALTLAPELQSAAWAKHKGKLPPDPFTQVAQAVKVLEGADAAIDRDLFSIAKVVSVDVIVARLALIDAELKRGIRASADSAMDLSKVASRVEGDVKKDQSVLKPVLAALAALRSAAQQYMTTLLKNAQAVRDELQDRFNAAKGIQKKQEQDQAKAADAKPAEGPEEDADLIKLTKLVRARTVPALRQVKANLPDMPAPQFMAALGPQHAAVMVAKHVGASTKGLLAKLLPGEKGIKYFHGEVLWESKCFTFVSDAAPGGSARKIQKALLALTKSKFKVRVRKSEVDAPAQEEQGEGDIDQVHVSKLDAQAQAQAKATDNQPANQPVKAIDEATLAKAIAAAAAKAAGVGSAAMKAEIAVSLKAADAERRKAEGMLDPAARAQSIAKSYEAVKKAFGDIRKAQAADPAAVAKAASDAATASAEKTKKALADNGKISSPKGKVEAVKGPGKTGVQVSKDLLQQGYASAGGSTARRSLAFGGKLVFEVTPVVDSKPAKYTLKGSLNLSLKLGASGENKDSGFGVKASVGAEMDYSFTHEFSVAQVQAFTDAAMAGQGGFKELDAAKLLLAGKPAEARKLLGLATVNLGRTASLQDLAEGDSSEVKLTATADAQVGIAPDIGVAKVGIAVGTSVAGSLSRTVDFKGGKYTISMKSVASKSQRGAGKVELTGVSLDGAASQEQHHSEEIKFEIPADDPKREAYFNQIMAARSLKDMQGLRALLKALYSVVIQTDGERDSSSMGVSAGKGALQAGLKGAQSSAYSESTVQASDGGTAQVFAGGNQRSMAVSAETQTAAEAGQEQQFVGGVGSDGKGFGQTQFTAKESDHEGTLDKLITTAGKKGIKRAVKNALNNDGKVMQEKAHTEGAVLGDESYADLIAKAHKGGSEWAAACDIQGTDATTIKAWFEVRKQVLDAGEDRAAIAKILAKFHARAADGSTDTLRKAVEATASGYEFPPKLATKKALYDSLVIKDPLPAALAAGNSGAVAAKLADLLKQVTQLGADIDAQAGEFKRQTDLTDMRQRIGARKHQLREAAAKVDGKLNQAQAAKVEAVIQIKEVAQRMLQFRLAEAKLFKAMEDEFKGFQVMGRELPKLGAVDVVALAKQETQLKNLYRGWDKDLDAMTRLLKDTGGDLNKIDPFKPNRQRFKELDAMIPGRAQGAGLVGAQA